jgi:hypothetical protein
MNMAPVRAKNKIGALWICSLLLSALALPSALATEYTLVPSPQTVHIGYFSASLKPVLTINSGDIVTIESVGGPDPADVDASGVVPPSAVPEYIRTIRRALCSLIPALAIDVLIKMLRGGLERGDDITDVNLLAHAGGGALSVVRLQRALQPRHHLAGTIPAAGLIDEAHVGA